jgi:hypothetical protein
MGISSIAGRHIHVTVGNRGITVSLQGHDDSGNISSTSPKESSVLVPICRVSVSYTFSSVSMSCCSSPQAGRTGYLNQLAGCGFYATAYPFSSQGQLVAKWSMKYLKLIIFSCDFLAIFSGSCTHTIIIFENENA